MPPLISHEEALRLGQLSDHAEIEALIERAWQARVERFATQRGGWPAHPIFGRMSEAEWLRWGYLHTDHHLRQFGA